METELQEAERFAREFLDSPWALFRTRLLARVFLAQQARLAEVERERDAWKLKAESEGIRIKWRDEERADAERKATELERERDEWRTAWDGVNTHRNQLREALAAAERKATELERERDAAIEARDIHNEMLLAAYRNNAEAYAARNAAERKATEAAREQQKAWVAGVRWMCEKFAEAPEVVRAAFTPDNGDVVFYCGERIENIAATLYPAPTEREATPPQAAPEPRIAKPSAQVSVGQKMVQRWDSDGFGRTWYRVVQKDFPNRDYGDFRAVLHAMMSNPPMPSAEEYAALLRLAQEAK